MQIGNVFCDMDGVLADFVTPACEFLKVKKPKTSAEDQAIFDKLWPSKDGYLKLKNEWPTFWMDLDLMPNALDLWKTISPWFPSLLSAIPDGWPTAATGKQVWAKRYLPKFGYHPQQECICCSRSQKQKYARQSDGTPNLLIDDFDKNTGEWEAAGGIAVLYTPPFGPKISKIASLLSSN